MFNLSIRQLFLCAIIALASCTSVKQSDPDPLDLAREKIDGGAVEEGLVILEEEMQKDPTRLALSNYYRLTASANKQFERSINFFKAAVEGKYSDVDEMYYNLAFAYIDKIPSVGPMGAGFLSKRAIKQFETVIERDPDDWAANYGIGMNYLHWPDYFKKNDRAMIYLEKTADLQRNQKTQPYFILTYIRLGDAYAKNGKIDEAYAIWQEGLDVFPNHADLVSRADTPKDKIALAMRELYNPNNSIGEINTDISVLWSENVPVELVPLTKNSLNQAGVGGLLKSSDIEVGDGKIGLFSWFMRNLPFLSDKTKFQNVDMSSLGIGENNATHDLASIVAHGMIMGFLSQFEEETPAQARARADKLSAFHRPFFHEGLGMGYAATASLDNTDELSNLIARLKKIDPHYTRLHLAGAGMWYGLESSNNLNKVNEAFARLGRFGEAYAYEGFGFSQTLFYAKNNPELIKNGELLGPDAAKNYYHGAGRAMWILSGNDMLAFHQKVANIPEKFRSHAYSGYGMGVAFTKVESPDFVFSFLDLKSGDELDLEQFLAGVSMGLTIRNIADSAYIKQMLASAKPQDSCRVRRALALGQNSLKEVSHGGGDLHDDWRREIHQELVSQGPLSQWKVCI